MRIGIICTDLWSERKKEELIPMNDITRPWCQFATKDQSIRRLTFKSKPIKCPSKRLECVPADVSIGLYIEYMYGAYGVTVDLIKPEELSVDRCRQNDINFQLIYDLLEAYHYDKEGPKYRNFREVLEKCDNVYPSYDFQKFINSKITYYNYLKAHNIKIAATITLESAEYAQKYPGGPLEAAKDLFLQMKADNWDSHEQYPQAAGKFIVKPVYGQESIDLFEGFIGWPEAKGWIPPKEYKKELKRLAAYLEKAIEKYPGLVFQKFIEGFGDEHKSPELRLYYIGDEYEYSMCTCGNSYLRPKEEGGRTNFPVQMLRRVTENIKAQLPKIILRGKEMPRLLTRFDMGYKENGKPVEPFVNEIEFVPSLYIEDNGRVVEDKLGDQMVKITCKLLGITLDQLAAATSSANDVES